MPEFVHLHNHTHFSLLDALCTTDDLINAAIADGQKSIAITDHGVMFGCFEFYKKARKAGIKPIIGFEAYVANGSRHEKISGKSKSRKRNYFHLVLLAKNETGYKNLLKLTTLAHTEGFYYKPRIDKELIEKYHEGVIATSACIAGVVNAHLIAGDYDEAYKSAKYYKDVFGEDFYIELQNHNLPDDKIILLDAPKIAKQLNIKIVATNDVHYLKSDHAVAHNVHLFIRDISSSNGKDVDIYKLRYRTPEMYFKTQKQMNELFIDMPQAIENTTEIADKCNLVIDTTRHMPEFSIPKTSKAKNLDDFLHELTYKGLKEKFEDLTPDILDRIEYELNVIEEMGFPGYFLIVQDFIKQAQNMGIRVGPGRGSVAGSLVAYALGITEVNPLKYDLLFERFLNPERKSMPDIDIDFADDKRDKIIDYVKRKYGEDSVAQIITFGKLSTRAVLKDVGRVLGIHHMKINDITSKIPVIQGRVTPLSDALKLPDLKYLTESEDESIKELIKFSQLLEGKLRNTSVHAAGVVIAPGSVSDYVPLYKQPKLKGQGIEVVSQYSMSDLEEAGLLKMDFLGLRTLSIIENTLSMIEKNYGEKIDISNIDFEDKKTFELISKGMTLAVFQFESKGMQEYLKHLKPTNLEELTAMNALYRPGPMDNIPEYIDRKHGKKPIKYLHPIMKKSLKNTYGIIVYQEQVMQLARDVAGFTLGGADILRKAMGKKISSVMNEQKPLFLEGAEKNSIDNKLASEIFDLIAKFADYGFNKSHSLAYSYLAYQTAWLKTHYTAEFIAANMSAEINDQPKIVQLIDEAKKFNIEVQAPDINQSQVTFHAVGNKILFGLAAIKNVGVSAVENIVQARSNKPFRTFFDFTSRADNRIVNRKAIEALICAGAFDSLKSGHRASIFESIDIGLDYAKSVQESECRQMDSLFEGSKTKDYVEPSLKDSRKWTERETLEKEKEFLNFYLTGHPLDRYKPYVNALSTMRLSNGNIPENQVVKICGMITKIRIMYDRKGKQFASITLEDFSGKAECVLWSNIYTKFGSYLNKNAVVVVSGKVEYRLDDLNIIVDELNPIEQAADIYAKGYNIWLDTEENNLNQITEFYKICNFPDSKKTVHFHISDKKKDEKKFYVAEDVNINFSETVVTELERIFGRDKVGFIT
jgi:DNA polymerase III subunit alpha